MGEELLLACGLAEGPTGVASATLADASVPVLLVQKDDTSNIQNEISAKLGEPSGGADGWPDENRAVEGARDPAGFVA